MEFLPNGSVSMPIQINEIDGGGGGKMVKARARRWPNARS